MLYQRLPGPTRARVRALNPDARYRQGVCSSDRSTGRTCVRLQTLRRVEVLTTLGGWGASQCPGPFAEPISARSRRRRAGIRYGACVPRVGREVPATSLEGVAHAHSVELRSSTALVIASVSSTRHARMVGTISCACAYVGRYRHRAYRSPGPTLSRGGGWQARTRDFH